MQHKTSCEIHYTVLCFFCEMGFYISGRYWPFVIVFGYTLRDLAVNLLSNDVSNGLDRKSSVAQRIVLYLAMLVIAVSCSTVIESLRKNRPSQGEVVSTDCNIVDVQNPVTQQMNLGQSTLGEVQLQALLSHLIINQVQALSESGDLHLPKVPSRSADIPEPQGLGGTEDLPHTELPSLPQKIPELQDFPLVRDLPPGGYVPHMDVHIDIRKLKALSHLNRRCSSC